MPAFVGSAQPEWVQLPFVANSFVKSFLFGGLCAIAAADVRRFERLVSLIVAGLCVWIVIAIPILIFGRTDPVHEVLGFDVSITAIMWGGIALQGAQAILFALLHRSAFRSRYGIRYLTVGPVPHAGRRHRGAADPRRPRDHARGVRGARRSLPGGLRGEAQVGDAPGDQRDRALPAALRAASRSR